MKIVQNFIKHENFLKTFINNTFMHFETYCYIELSVSKLCQAKLKKIGIMGTLLIVQKLYIFHLIKAIKGANDFFSIRN